MISKECKEKLAELRKKHAELDEVYYDESQIRVHLKDLLKYIPLVCFTAIIITEISCGFDKHMIGYAVFGLFVLLMFGAV